MSALRDLDRAAARRWPAAFSNSPEHLIGGYVLMLGASLLISFILQISGETIAAWSVSFMTCAGVLGGLRGTRRLMREQREREDGSATGSV